MSSDRLESRHLYPGVDRNIFSALQTSDLAGYMDH